MSSNKNLSKEQPHDPDSSSVNTTDHKLDGLELEGLKPDNQDSSEGDANRFNPRVPKSKTGFKRWLPAIVFAVILHMALLGLFFINKPSSNNIEANTNRTDIDNPSLEKSATVTQTEVEITELDTEDPPKVTTSENASDVSSSISDAASDNPTTKTTNFPKSTTPPPIESTTSTAVLEENTYSNNQINSKPINNGAQPSTPVQMNRPSINPNEAVLLSRDLPSSKHEAITTDGDYENKAKEVEAINNKISAAIDAVKEKNLADIKAREQAIADESLNSSEIKPPIDTIVISKDKVNTEEQNINVKEVTSITAVEAPSNLSSEALSKDLTDASPVHLAEDADESDMTAP